MRAWARLTPTEGPSHGLTGQWTRNASVFFFFNSSLFGHATLDSFKGIVHGFSMLNCVVNMAAFSQVALHSKFKPIIHFEHDFTHSLKRFSKFSYVPAIVKFMTIGGKCTWIINKFTCFDFQTFKCAIFLCVSQMEAR